MIDHKPPSPLLQVHKLQVSYPVAGGAVQAVNGVDLHLNPGEILGLVGESGCGKSSLARAIMGLVPIAEGSLQVAGENIPRTSRQAWRRLWRRMQIVFQDPYASLNPRWRVGDCIAEPLHCFAVGTRKERQERVRQLIDVVGLPADSAERYPHEFSGGQRQRIGIARALALQPEILICDEPVSALDVSVQAQIINLLLDLRDQFGLSLIVIAHDLAVIRHIADRVAVMYLGNIVEHGPSASLFSDPQHPYSEALLAAAPSLHSSASPRPPLRGDPPSPEHRPPGCAFA
ncbi:MAG: ATP-binding cassette domain-containing protein, partial [Planctomycetota bacterium]